MRSAARTRPGQARGVRVVVGCGHREARGLDALLDQLDVDQVVAPEALLDEQLAAVHVVGGERGVGGPGRQLTTGRADCPVAYRPSPSARQTPLT